MKTLLLLFAAAGLVPADGPGLLVSRYAKRGFALTADPEAKQWKGVKGVFAENGPQGEPHPDHRTEIRSRWTDQDLYFLFICPYDKLYLKMNPVTDAETNRLWEWDVAEVFVGSDFQHIRRYKEFEMSPRGEWVDLDIDRDFPREQGGWKWNSGWKVKGRIDSSKKIWYGEMRIPLASIDKRRAENGLEMRLNLYRCQGPPQGRVYIAWQPTGSPSFHVPEAFGRLRLEGK